MAEPFFSELNAQHDEGIVRGACVGEQLLSTKRSFWNCRTTANVAFVRRCVDTSGNFAMLVDAILVMLVNQEVENQDEWVGA